MSRLGIVMRFARCAAALIAALSVPRAFDAFADDGHACGAARQIVVDRIWNGAPVDFAAKYRAGSIYLGYYDADRRLVAARYDPRGTLLEKVALDELFDGWDAHNGIEIEVDNQGYVHLAGNMHASPLVYFRSAIPYSVASFRRQNAIVGREEARVTYPRFMRRGDDLFFTYRAGTSGDGRWMLDVFRDEHWRRVGAVFADRDAAGGPVSAYPTRYVEDGTGFYTVAYVWRHGPDAALNHNLCFARSSDLTHWYSLGGQPMQSPLGSDCKDPIADPGPNHGLSNTPVLLSDGRGTPIVLYSMLDERRHNQVYIAIGAAGGWQTVALTDWTAYYGYRGKGSLRVPFAIAAAKDDDRNRILISVRHDLFGRSDFALDLSSLAVTKLHRGSGAGAPEPDGKSASPRGHVLPILDESGRRRATLQWATRPSNNDRPPVCAACETHVSDLILDIPQCEGYRG